ncbi:CDP-glycerol glycerophosphotransferase family protein [Thiomicrospira microaerophila]|uniref:CDP-glycerol glycerophosphotransferase family protein n=1 Tax=Thiomicrospira microaerophila TaxID=406020 RepID=UPI001E2CB4DF|nr:CDP-glycerol glycerophosphotransferase family protein [Thiomicrospira microaerophila]
MSHGAADKNYHFRKASENGVKVNKRINHERKRKHLFVPGNWLKNRIVNSKVLKFDETTVHAVGWPRLDYLKEIAKARPPKKQSNPRKTILWAPTHDYARRGPDEVSLSSYPEFEPFLEQLKKDYDVEVSLHPRNRKDKAPTDEKLLRADIVITDFGTMVYEAIALGKQVIFPDWLIGDRIRKHLKHSAEYQIYKNKFGLHAESFEHLKQLIEQNTPINQESQAFFNDYLKTTEDTQKEFNSAKYIANLLLELDSKNEAQKGPLPTLEMAPRLLEEARDPETTRTLQILKNSNAPGYKTINIVTTQDPNYLILQDQLIQQFATYLPEEIKLTQSIDYQEDALNITFFIQNQADIFIVPFLADRNYCWTKNKQKQLYINQFKTVLVPGDWLKNRFLKSPSITLKKEQIIIVGSIRLDGLHSVVQYNQENNKKINNLAWLPVYTQWKDKSKTKMSSYPELQTVLKKLPDEIKVQQVPHPSDRKDKTPVHDQLMQADAIITDYSSTLYEAWALNKPVIFPRWLLQDKVLEKAPGSAEGHIYREKLGRHPESEAEFIELFNQDLMLSPNELEFAQHCIKNIDNQFSTPKAIQDFIIKICDKGRAERITTLKQTLSESIQQKRWAQAEAAVSELIQLNTDEPELYSKLAHMLRKQGKWWQEVEALKKAIELSPQYPTWHYRLGEALEAMNRHQQAAQAYGQAIELKQGKAEAQWYYRQGYCYQTQGHDGAPNLSAVKKAYDQAIAKDNKLNAKRFGIGVFHQVRGLWPQAQQAYAKQLNKTPWDAELCYRLGMAHDRCYEWSQAQEYYELALALDITQTYWHYRLGFVLERQNKFEQAAIAYEYAAKNRDKHTPYWFYRWGYVLEQAGKHDQACLAYLQTRNQPELDKPEPILDVEYNQEPSEAHNALNATQADQAELALAEAKISQPETIDPLEEYKQHLTNQSVIAQHLERILQQDTTNPQTWYKLGNAYERMQNWLKAAEAYQHALDRQNDHTPDWYYRLGYVLTQAESYQAACESFSKIDYLQGFNKRITRECPVEIINLEFNDNIYTLTASFQNKSKLNEDVAVQYFYLKHRERIGNEVDEHPLTTRCVHNDNIATYEFEINAADLNLAMHYWDLYIQLEAVDKVYGDVLVPIQLNRFAPDMLEKIDTNPWVLATRDEDTIFHPYRTVGGRKMAFLKRPRTEYDDPIYTQREQQALAEYQQDKQALDNRQAWMIYEKFSKTAQDNGFYFFKYAVKQRPHVYYVIEKDSPDRQYLKDYEDNVVEFMSVEHMKLLLSCEKIISSEGRGHGYAWRRISGDYKTALLNKQYIFLQHGVIGLKRLGNDFSKTNKNFAANKFVCSTQTEKEIIMTEFGYNEEDMILSGLPRWDGLTDTSDKHNELFLMPTWRNWLEDMSDEDFLQSDYFKHYAGLLSSPKLSELLTQHNLVLNFYLHPKVIVHLDKFKIDHEHIKIVDFGEYTIRELLQRAKVLITDYSSVAWDFVYMGKHVVFYHFDLEKYEKYQGAYIDLRNNMPGKVAVDQAFLVNIIEQQLNNIEDRYIHGDRISINDNTILFGEGLSEHIYNEISEKI